MIHEAASEQRWQKAALEKPGRAANLNCIFFRVTRLFCIPASAKAATNNKDANSPWTAWGFFAEEAKAKPVKTSQRQQ